MMLGVIYYCLDSWLFVDCDPIFACTCAEATVLKMLKDSPTRTKKRWQSFFFRTSDSKCLSNSRFEQMEITGWEMEMKVAVKGCRKLGTICSMSLMDFKMSYVVSEDLMFRARLLWPGLSFRYLKREHIL